MASAEEPNLGSVTKIMEVTMVTENIGVIVLAMAGIILLLFIWNILLQNRMSRLSQDYETLMTGTEGEDLNAIIQQHLKKVQHLTRQYDSLLAANERLGKIGQTHIQRVSLLRYNAFDDVGSNQSFSLAMLDWEGTGVVLTSLYGRSESRFYAKPVEKGSSALILSAEEDRVLKDAMATPSLSFEVEEDPKPRRKRKDVSEES